MPFYVKKTNAPIEGRQLTERNQAEIMKWCCGSKGLDGSVRLKTPESDGETQVAVTGDFIMKGYTDSLGWHFWPVKPDYFEQNYQQV